MEDQLFSLRCPNCQQSLFEAFFFRFGFFKEGACPYCGLQVRLVKAPLFLSLFGVLIAGTALYCLINQVTLIETTFPVTMGAFGMGAALFLFGLIFTHFEIVDVSERPRNQLRPYANY